MSIHKLNERRPKPCRISTVTVQSLGNCICTPPTWCSDLWCKHCIFTNSVSAV